MIPTPFDGHPPAAEPGARLGPFDGGVHRITQVEQRALPHHHVAVQTGNLEQLVHDRVQLRGLGAEDLQRGAPTDRWLPEVAAREKAQVAAQDAERPTQLVRRDAQELADRKSTRLNSSHRTISYAVFCLKKKKKKKKKRTRTIRIAAETKKQTKA